jgi:hypothetical protein
VFGFCTGERNGHRTHRYHDANVQKKEPKGLLAIAVMTGADPAVRGEVAEAAGVEPIRASDTNNVADS